jgi:hypothetical protein
MISGGSVYCFSEKFLSMRIDMGNCRACIDCCVIWTLSGPLIIKGRKTKRGFCPGGGYHTGYRQS